MRKTGLLLLLGVWLLCAGCDRGTRTDLVLFCREFNQRSTSLQFTEENTFRRGEKQLLLFAEEILLQMDLTESGAIHTLTLSAENSDLPLLAEAAADAFAITADASGDAVPQSLEQFVLVRTASVRQIETDRFAYLVYADERATTVVQISLLLSSFPDQPTLRHAEPE